jgi:hypothetical protein
MTYAECYSERLNRVLAELKFGTLRFWGVWFGKPNDNVHGIVGSNADRNLLRIGSIKAKLLLLQSQTV